MELIDAVGTLTNGFTFTTSSSIDYGQVAHSWTTLSTEHGSVYGRRTQTHDDASAVGPRSTDTSMVSKTKLRDRKQGQRFPRCAVRILEAWLLDHHDNPYATSHAQDELKIRTGLKCSQIRNWIANARKRRKIHTLQPSTPSPAQPQPEPSLPLVFSHVAALHPFERWLRLGPEHEPASLSAIQEAIAQGQVGNSLTNRSSISIAGSLQCRGTSANWQYFRQAGSSISSLEIRSYAANIRSVSSDQWKNPDRPALAVPRMARRHRRADSHTGSTLKANRGGDSLRGFQCTFCNHSFKKKHDWQRHEKSQHLPLEQWICCPQGSTNVDPATSEITCVFCGVPDPDPEHIHAHGYALCVSRSTVERTFYRKDHLRQHLRLMHGECPMISTMEEWKTTVNDVHSRCGFCNASLDTWNARVEHLADHFRDGALMREWEGDWGFDARVSSMLERSILPASRRPADPKLSIATILQRNDRGIVEESDRSSNVSRAAPELNGGVSDLNTQHPMFDIEYPRGDALFNFDASVSSDIPDLLESLSYIESTMDESLLPYFEDGITFQEEPRKGTQSAMDEQLLASSSPLHPDPTVDGTYDSCEIYCDTFLDPNNVLAPMTGVIDDITDKIPLPDQSLGLPLTGLDYFDYGFT